MQHTVAARLKQLGHTSIVREKFYGPKGVDLVSLAPNGDLLGFEMTVSKGNLVQNFDKDFAAQPRFARITAVCLSQRDAGQAKKTLFADSSLRPFHGRMEARPIADWL